MFKSYLLALLPLLMGSCKPESEISQTYRLKPTTTETLTLSVRQDAMVGFELTSDESKKQAEGDACPNRYCIELKRTDDFGMVKGQYGAGTIMSPKDGKIVLEIKNLTQFPLDIRVYAKDPKQSRS